MKCAVLIEFDQPVIGGPKGLRVTCQGDYDTFEGIRLCNAGIAYFLRLQEAAEIQAAAEAHAAANGLLDPNGQPIAQ